jgi:hypothetical protein
MNSPSRLKAPRSSPKSATVPAKRKRGRPLGTARAVPRTRTLPRVSEAVYKLLSDYAEKHGLFLADAVEEAARSLNARRPEKFA